jgi:virginiamycin B lyase
MERIARLRLLPTLVLMSASYLASIPAIAATAPTIDEFSTSFSGNSPQGITLGPDGAMWFAESAFHAGRISTGASPVVTEYSIVTGSGFPVDIAAGPDGAMWFTELNPDTIGRVTTDVSHTVTDFPTPTSGSFPPPFLQGIAAGPDGAMWFAELGNNKIGRITTTASPSFTEYPTPGNGGAAYIAAGPDGAMWFTQAMSIGRITTGASPMVTIFSTTAASGNQGIALGPDGAMWFTEQSANQIGRITTDGSHTVTEYSVPTTNAGLQGISVGPDGAIWFTEKLANKIGRISTDASHVVTEYAVPTQSSSPFGIAMGPNSTLWFTEQGVGKIGRITVPTAMLSVTTHGNGLGTVTSSTPGIACGPTCNANFGLSEIVTLTATPASGTTFVGWNGGGCVGIGTCTVTLTQATAVTANFVSNSTSNIILVSALLPTSRSVVVGAPATFFGTMINASADTAGNNCTVAPTTSIPATFSFQTTDSATNGLTGTANTPVNITPGAAQSFLLSFTPQSAFPPTDVAFSFTCTNAAPATTSKGLNTFLLSGSATATPDVIALVATASNDGIVNIPGIMGTGAFAVATANVGATGTITASANGGAANLPVAITICQTNPTSGQCLASPSASVATTIGAGTTPTFAIFVKGSNTVPFQPAANRIFVQFQDAGGALRGSTSVAVRTQ